MEIVTNNQWRNLLYGCELTESELAEFDWVEDALSHDFIRYKGRLYSLDEFMLAPDSLSDLGWHCYCAVSAFSGIAIKISSDGYQAMPALVLS